jgi:dTDP-4-dehydrorhamnose reductase
MQKKILVTGSNGQLGQELQQLEKDYPNFQFIFTNKDDLPIDNAEKINVFFATHKIDYCINTAAYTAVDKAESEKELAYSINALGAKYLATVCNKHQTKFIHISTDYVFDGTQKTPYKETHLTNPINYYGLSKLDGEKFVLHENADAIIVRTSWVYSAFGNNFVKTMIRLMQTKESITVINDQIGSPTYAASLAKVILKFVVQNEAGKAFQGIYNYSSDSVLSWYYFANEIKKQIGSKCIVHPIPTTDYPTPAKRSPYSVLDKTKIATDLNEEFINWKVELATCISKLNL